MVKKSRIILNELRNESAFIKTCHVERMQNPPINVDPFSVKPSDTIFTHLVESEGSWIESVLSRAFIVLSSGL
jgi:hypothetical protein